MEQDLEQLNKRITELENKFNNQTTVPVKLDRYLDPESKDVIATVMKERIFDLFWSNVFFISSVFEGVDRYVVTGSATVSSVGLLLSTSSGSCSANLDSKDDNPLLIDKKTYLSTIVGIGDVSEVVFQVDILEGIGFRIDAGTIKGYTYDGSTTNELSIGTAADNTPYRLDLRYDPRGKVDFYVDGVLKGTVTSNLPPIATTDPSYIINYTNDPKTGGSGVTSAEVTYFALMQER